MYTHTHTYTHTYMFIKYVVCNIYMLYCMIWSFLTCFFTQSYIFEVYLFWWIYPLFQVIPLFSSVQFSHSVMSDSLRPHESQHARPPCPSPTPGLLDHTKFIHSSMKEYFIVSKFLLLKVMLIEDFYEVFLKPWTQFSRVYFL